MKPTTTLQQKLTETSKEIDRIVATFTRHKANYDTLFEDLQEHSTQPRAYLDTWAQIEKEMPLHITGEKKKAITELTESSATLIETAGKLITYILHNERIIENLTPVFLTLRTDIKNNPADEERHLRQINQFNTVCANATEACTHMQEAFQPLQELFQQIDTQFKGLKE